MEHSFDIEIAQEYGVECAIIIKHLYYWIKKNKACDKNFHDGMYWTYGSVKSFGELFPYMGDKKIRNAINKLESSGLIVIGNYNDLPFDRTKWYALTEKGVCLIEKREVDSAKGQMTFGETPDDIRRKDEPIPDINTDIETDNITVSKDTVRRTDVQRVVAAWNSLSDCGIKPISKIGTGSKRHISLTARIREYGTDAVLEAINNIRNSNFLQGKAGGKRQWMITFDWFVLPSNFPKVLEGNYSDKQESIGKPKGNALISKQFASESAEPPDTDDESYSDLPEEDEEGWIDFGAMSEEEYREFLKSRGCS